MATSATKQTKHNLPPKRTLKVFKGGLHPSLYYIGFKEGGVVSRALSSSFTKKELAERFLASYLKEKSENKSYLDHVRDKENGESKDKEGE